MCVSGAGHTDQSTRGSAAPLLNSDIDLNFISHITTKSSGKHLQTIWFWWNTACLHLTPASSYSFCRGTSFFFLLWKLSKETVSGFLMYFYTKQKDFFRIKYKCECSEFTWIDIMWLKLGLSDAISTSRSNFLSDWVQQHWTEHHSIVGNERVRP